MFRQMRLANRPAIVLVGVIVLPVSGSGPVYAQASDPGPADAQSIAIVAAAQDFLSSEQQEAALFAFNDQKQRSRWSNFPEGFCGRSGVRWGDISAAQ